MQRRVALRSGAALFCGVSLTGCLDALATESAWRNLVIDRPEAVYVPPKVDEMTLWGTASTADYALSLSATRPHRFWTVTGTETNQIAMREAHSVHLMVSVRGPEFERYVPAAVRLSLDRGDERLLDRTLWPMLSQRMGPHHGGNVALPESGRYTAAVQVVPESVRRSGSTESDFEPTTHDIGFEYDPAAIDALDRTILPKDRRGRPGAVEPMGHGRADLGHHDHDGRDEIDLLVPIAPPTAAFSDPLGTERVGDCPVVVAVVDGTYLVASVRTPYNGFPVPMASLSARIDRGSTTETMALFEASDPDVGHHYGAPVDPLASGDRVTIAVETPSQMARHEGYETALFERGRFTLRVPR